MDKIYDIEIPEESTKRSIVDLFDIETGEYIDGNEVIEKRDEAILSRMREVLSLAYKSHKYKYVCAVCNQPVRLIGKRIKGDRISYFFGHFPGSDSCPVKTSNGEYNPLRLSIYWYQKFLNSNVYGSIKKSFLSIISTDSSFKKTETDNNKSVIMADNTIVWNHSDVKTFFKDYRLAIQFQVYNTLLSKKVFDNSFFKREKTFLLRLFPYFSPAQQSLCEKDVYYAHHRNVFVFDSEDYYSDDDNASKPARPTEDGYEYAQEASLKYGKLMFNCYWQEPIIEDNNVRIKWNHKLISIYDFRFDDKDFDCYYYDSDKTFYSHFSEDKQQLIDDWENSKKKRWDKIFKKIDERDKDYSKLATKREERDQRLKKRSILADVISGKTKIEAVKSEDSWGFEAEGVNLIPCRYKEVKSFEDNVAFVKIAHWGAIDVTGKKILPLQYTFVESLGNHLYVVSNLSDESELIKLGKKGFEKIRSLQCDIIQRLDGNYFLVKSKGYIDKYGFVLFDSDDFQFHEICDYNYLSVAKVRPYLYVVANDRKQRGVIKLTDNGLSEICPCKYRSLRPKDGIMIMTFTNKNYTRYDVCVFGDNPKENLYLASKTTKISSDLWSTMNKEKHYGILSSSGDTMLGFNYSCIKLLKGRNLIECQKASDNLYSLYDLSLNLIEENYPEPINDDDEHYFTVKIDENNYTLYDINGRRLLYGYSSPFKFIDDDIILTSLNHFAGICNVMGEVIVPFVYNSIDCIPNSRIIGHRKNDKDVLMALKPYKQIFSYDTIKYDFDPIRRTENMIVSDHGLYGVADSQGLCIIPCKYYGIEGFHRGESEFTILSDKGDSQFGIIDIEGRIIVQPIPFKILDYNTDFILVYEQDKEIVGAADLKGNLIVPIKYHYRFYEILCGLVQI